MYNETKELKEETKQNITKSYFFWTEIKQKKEHNFNNGNNQRIKKRK